MVFPNSLCSFYQLVLTNIDSSVEIVMSYVVSPCRTCICSLFSASVDSLKSVHVWIDVLFLGDSAGLL